MSNLHRPNTAGRRRFAVTVDGVRHEVIVEELTESDREEASTASPPAPAPTDNDDKGLTEDGWILAPMPGTVTEVAVEAGQTVAPGDVLVILTAMKLENEITSPAAGVVLEIPANPGDNVDGDDRLVRLERKEVPS